MRYSITLISLLLFSPLSYAQEINLTLLSQSAPGNIYDRMVIEDTLLYCFMDDLGIFNISDPANPILMQILPISMNARHSSEGGANIIKNGDYLYFPFGNGNLTLNDSLCVVDVSDAYYPYIEEKISLGNDVFVSDMEILNDYLFICCKVNNNSYMRIYDISNVSPEFITEEYYDYCYSYVELFEGFTVVNRSDFVSPPDLTFYSWDGATLDSLSSIENLSDLHDIFYYQGYLYAGCTLNFMIIDAQDPYHPFMAANPTFPGNNQALANHFGSLLLTSGSTMCLFDISNPLHPNITYTFPSTGGVFYEQCISQQYLYTMKHTNSAKSELMTYNISNIYQLELRSTIYAGYSNDAEIYLQRYALLSQYNSLKVFDVLDPQNPILITELFTGKNIYNTAILGNSAYVFMKTLSGHCYFRVVDFSNPSEPIIGDSIYFAQFNNSDSKLYTINDSTMYLFDGDWFIFDVNQGGLSLADSVISGNYSYDNYCRSDSIAVLYSSAGTIEDRAYLYIDNGDRNPIYITTIETEIRIKSCLLAGQYLIIGVGDDYPYYENGLIEIYDISDPYHPTLIQSQEAPYYVTHMETDSEYVYLFDYISLKVFNRNLLPDLVIVDSLYVGDFCEGLVICDSILYAAGYLGGLYIIGNEPEANIDRGNDAQAIYSYKLSSAFPNPFNSKCVIMFQLPKTEKVKLAVYNILGQRVAMLAEGTFEAGNHSVKWNGRNDNGGTLSSGIYFYQIQAGDFVKTGKMILLK